MKKILLMFLILLSLSCQAKKARKYNSWTDRESLRECLATAAKERKTYFSNFKYYDYTQHSDIYTSRMPSDLGHPYMYGIDFYQAMGNYLPAEMVAEQKSNLAKIIKQAWNKNRAIPVASWHLHSPYAVFSEFKKNMGCRYNCKVKEFPKNHQFIINEILTNKQVDTLGIAKMGDWFDDQVRELADFINKEMVDKDGNPIPFIFRLWHEQQDSWAWWCYSQFNKKTRHVTVEDYISFWRLTVEKFRAYCPKAQILWCYGPDRYFSNEEQYMKSYPGDDVVDLFAYDDYWIGRPDKFQSEEQMVSESIKRARIVTKVAKEHGKISFIAESNCHSKGQKDVYFDYVQQILKDDQVNMVIFQLWSMSYYKEPTIRFIDSKNIIFDK